MSTDLPTASVVRRKRRPPPWTSLSAPRTQKFGHPPWMSRHQFAWAATQPRTACSGLHSPSPPSCKRPFSPTIQATRSSQTVGKLHARRWISSTVPCHQTHLAIRASPESIAH